MHGRLCSSPRVALRYTVNLALTFVGDQMQQDTSTEARGLDWAEQVKALDAFMFVSDQQENQLAERVERCEKAEAEDEEAQIAQQRSGEQPAGEVLLAAKDYVVRLLAPAPPTSKSTSTIPSPTVTESLSSRGRVRKQKTFGDQFVLLHDDGVPD